MKITFSSAFILGLSLYCTSASGQSYYFQKLIGIWNYVETRDDMGNKISQYNERFGTVIASGPQLIYRSDSTYQKIFTPNKADNGKWAFDELNMIIEHYLYIDTTDFVGKDLVKRGLAQKQKDGNYYELIKDKVVHFDDTEIVIKHRKVFDMFRKEK